MSEQPTRTPNVRLWVALSLLALAAAAGAWIIVIVLLRDTL
jgi:hypothetical protein